MTNKKQFKTIDEYIKTFPKDVQGILEKMSKRLGTIPNKGADSL